MLSLLILLIIIVTVISIIFYLSCTKDRVYPTVIVVENALEVSWDSNQLGSAGLAYENPTLNDVDVLNTSSEWSDD